MRRSLLGLLLLGMFSLAYAQDPPPKDDPPDEPDEPQGKVQLALNTGGHYGMIHQMFFTPDSKRLITVGGDSTVQFWNVQTGERERVLWLPGSLREAAFSPDGKTLAVVGPPPAAAELKFSPIWLIRLEDGSIRSLDKRPNGTVGRMAFSPKGDRLAFVLNRNRVILWDLKSDRQSLTLQSVGQVTGLLFSPDGNQLLLNGDGSRSYDLTIRPGDKPILGKEVIQFAAEQRALAWSPDGKRVLTDTGSKPAAVTIWSETGERLRSHVCGPKAVPRHIMQAHFLNDGEVVLIWGGSLAPTNASGLLLNLQDNSQRALFWGAALSHPYIRSAVSVDGRLIAATDYPQHHVVLRSLPDGKELHRLGHLSPRSPAKVSWGSDGKALAWRLRPLDTKKKDPLKGLERGLDIGELKSLGQDELKDFLPNRQTQDGWTVRTINNKTPDVAAEIMHGDKVMWQLKGTTAAARWSFFRASQGEMRLVRGQYSSVRVWDAETGKQVASLGYHPRLTDLAVSPDSRFLVLSRGTPELWLYRLDPPDKSGKPLLKLLFTDTDWIIWTDQGYYAASPGGEKLIGWRVDNGPGKLASFYPAGRFRKELHRPDIIKLVFEKGSIEEALKAAKAKTIDLEKLLPPKCSLQIDDRQKPKVTVKVTSEAQAKEQPVTALRLLLDGRPLPNGEGHVEFKDGQQQAAKEWTITLPPGEHHLAVLARSPDASSLSNVVMIRNVAAAQLPALHVLAIGIDAYQDPALKLDFAAADARAVADAFRKGCKGPLFQDVKGEPLVNNMATRQGVQQALAELRKEVKPNDLVVVFFAGHGVKHKDQFYLLTAEANLNNLAQTALSGTELRKTLGEIPCQVLLMLDACHSAAGVKAFQPATDDLTRALTDDEVGVAVLCAAMAHEKAIEKKELKQGLFTHALVQALTAPAGVPCHPLTGRQYLHHLHSHVFDRVLVLSDDRQHPFLSLPWVVESFPLRQLSVKLPEER